MRTLNELKTKIKPRIKVSKNLHSIIEGKGGCYSIVITDLPDCIIFGGDVTDPYNYNLGYIAFVFSNWNGDLVYNGHKYEIDNE